jgi:formylglycine-generating enzyme required for sulfatase activity
MGASFWDREAQSDERPQVAVDIPRVVAIGRYEVTFDEWQACTAAGGCRGYVPDDSGWGRGRRPAIWVSFEDAQAYLAWLQQKTGRPYRLPTEAEWEYACHAGTETKYPWGDEPTTALANYDRAAGRTREVGASPPNPWGLSDLNGNVWEWVEDVWQAGHDGQPADGTARLDGVDTRDRVIRGGSWDDRARRIRCVSRNHQNDSQRADEIGFRVAVTLSSAPAAAGAQGDGASPSRPAVSAP